jgi:hypothetical protein
MQEMKTLLVDVPGEDSVRDDQMWVDSASFAPTCAAIFGFTFLTVLTCLGGRSALSAAPFQRRDRGFSNGTAQTFSLTSTQISGYNRWLAFDLIYVHPSPEIAPVPIYFAYKIECSTPTTQFTKIKRQVEPFAPANIPLQNETVPIRIFYDRFLNYQAAELILTVAVPPASAFTKIALLSSAGSPEYTTFHIYFRSVYSVIEIVVLILFFTKSGLGPFATWTREQRLTVRLLGIASIANNPIYFLNVRYPHPASGVVEALLEPSFHLTVLFMSLVVFDSLMERNVKSDRFGLVRIIWVLPVFVCQVLIGCYSFRVSFLEPEVPPTRNAELLRNGEAMAYALFILCSLANVGRVICSLDVTEKFKFALYLSASILLMTYAAFVCLNAWFKFFDNDNVNWVLSFAAHNMFALMMAYFHWPYELVQSRPYQMGSCEHAIGQPLMDNDLGDSVSVSDLLDSDSMSGLLDSD